MANLKTSKSVVNVGIDIGKQFLDVCIYENNKYWREENSNAGIKRLLKRLAYYQIERLVMEATGRYEFALAQVAYGKGLPVCIVKPLLVRRYAGTKSSGIPVRVNAIVMCFSREHDPKNYYYYRNNPF